MRKSLALFFLFICSLQAQINLGPTNKQVRGVLPIVNGGTALNAVCSNLTTLVSNGTIYVCTNVLTDTTNLVGDVTGTYGATVVGDDSHAHTTTTLSGIDISADTNLAVTSPVTLTGDNIGLETLGGDVTGTIAASVVGNDSHTHGTSTIAGLDIGDDTNLSVSDPITILADNLGFNLSTNLALTGIWDFGDGTLELPNSTTLPATCVVGQSYFDSNATLGQQFFICTSVNTWTLQGDGGGAGASDSFKTIGNAISDSSTDTLTVTDSGTIDFTTTNDPEDLTGIVIADSINSTHIDETANYTWMGTQVWIGDQTFNPTTQFEGSIVFSPTLNNENWQLLFNTDGSLDFQKTTSASNFDFEISNPGAGVATLTVEGAISGPNVTSGANPGHTHTTTSLSGIDISADTNLAVTAPVVLTDDTLSLSSSVTLDTEWDTLAEIETAITYDFSSATNLDTGTIPAARVGAGHIDASTEIAGSICGTNEILEDQGAVWACIATPSGSFTSFNIDGDNNSPQTITNGNEALLVGGTGITTTAAATDQVTIDVDQAANLTWTGKHQFTPITSILSTIPYVPANFDIDSGIVFRPTPVVTTGLTYANVSSILDMGVSDIDSMEHQGFYSYVKMGSTAQTSSYPTAYDFLVEIPAAGGTPAFIYGLRGNINNFLADGTLHGTSYMFSLTSAGSKKVSHGLWIGATGGSTAILEPVHISTGWEQYGIHITTPISPASDYAGLYIDSAPILLEGMTAPATPPADHVYLYAKDGSPDTFCVKDDAGTENCVSDVAAGTVTLTNKTLDAEGTGNNITEPIRIMLMMAGSQAGVGVAALNCPSANAPAPVDKSAGGFLIATLDFDDATDESCQWLTKWPVGADETNVDLELTWFGAATTGDAIWSARSACLAVGEAISDLAWNTAGPVTDTAAGTTLDWNIASIANLPITNCADSEHLWIEFSRDANNGSDTFAGDASLVSAELIVRVTK